LAGSTILQTCKNAEEAEALAVWTGLDTAYKHNLKLSVLESDNVTVVHAQNCSSVNASVHCDIYSNIKAMSTFFSDLRFGKVDRCCNNLAYELTQRAKVHRATHVWLMSFPDFVLEIYNGDHVNLARD
jgi:hypothetical protein